LFRGANRFGSNERGNRVPVADRADGWRTRRFSRRILGQLFRGFGLGHQSFPLTLSLTVLPHGAAQHSAKSESCQTRIVRRSISASLTVIIFRAIRVSLRRPYHPGVEGRFGVIGPKPMFTQVVDDLDYYWNDPERTAAAFKNGWFHSGDLATIDAEGYITIIDRKKGHFKGAVRTSHHVRLKRRSTFIPAWPKWASLACPTPAGWKPSLLSSCFGPVGLMKVS
jgi:hypothetical protein